MSLTPERCSVCKAKLKNGKVEGCALPIDLNKKITHLGELRQQKGENTRKGMWAILFGIVFRNRDLRLEIVEAEISQMEKDLENCWGIR